MPLQSMSHFKAFRMTAATIKAISIREAEKAKKHSFDQCWVVFDKDDYPDNDFNQAILLAKSNGFRVAYIYVVSDKLSTMPMQYWQKFPTGTPPKKNRPQQSKNWLLSLTNTSNRLSFISSYLSKKQTITVKFVKILQIHKLSFQILTFDW